MTRFASRAFVVLLILPALCAQDSRPDSRATRLFHPSARWIWSDASDRAVDAYRLFRKDVTLRTLPTSARIRIGADTEYRLFVNGTYVGRGPAPNPPSHASIDEIDVTRHLRAGENAIAVIVHHAGVPTFPRVLGRPGLIFDLEVGSQRVVTDASWRTSDAWWVPTGERLTPMREFTEELDARKEPEGWTAAGFDDSTWSRATEIGPEGTKPWIASELRDIPLPDDMIVTPKRIVFTAACDETVPPKKDAAKVLAAAPERPTQKPVRFDRLLSGGAASIDARAEEGVVVCLDFETEVSGFLDLTIYAGLQGGVIDLGYGEGIDEARHVSVTKQDMPHCDRLRLRAGPQTLRIFHHRAFRYLVLAVRGGSVDIHNLRVVESGYPVRHRGAFSCSDPLLNRIWAVGRRTMQLCMDQGFMDCPWRERGQYIGDGLAEGPVALYAFGDTKLMRRFLRQASLCQPADGLLEPAYPCDWTLWHGERGPNRIPGYGALWVVMLESWWRATGDLDLVKSVAGVMDRQLAWFERFRGPGGLLTSAPEWNFIDWAPLDPRAALACLNLQYLMALRAAAALDEALGRPPVRAAEAARVAVSFRAAHWDDARGLFRDFEGGFSVHTNALALLTLVDDPKIADRVIAGLASPDLVLIGSPYFEGYGLRALARHGRHELALKLIKARLAPMLAAGATTLWEAYVPFGSLCHAWSCEPTAFLSRDILGVSYDAPRRTVRFAPRLSGLTWAMGTVPAQCGDITVRLAATESGVTAAITTPHGVALEVDDGVRAPTRLAGGSHELTLSR